MRIPPRRRYLLLITDQPNPNNTNDDSPSIEDEPIDECFDMDEDVDENLLCLMTEFCSIISIDVTHASNAAICRLLDLRNAGKLNVRLLITESKDGIVSQKEVIGVDVQTIPYR